jgi:demethylmenaquinone methyltransferase/2-methoxy-6-polyprenyl-1,4-benzoquinol methylase
VAAPEVPDYEVVHAPHPPLTGYYGRAENRPGWVQRMFDGTAADYDRIERLIGFGSGSGYRRDALRRAGLKQGMQILDVGVGTGLVARQAAEIVADPACVTGLDPSVGMLHNAHVPAGIRLVEGYAENIPYPDASFDFVSMGYALRHIADLSVAFCEFFRVLRPGGRLCILEVTRPENRFHAALLKCYLHGVVPWLAKLAARQADTPLLWSYYWDTIDTCVAPGGVLRTLESAGFADVHRHLELGIFSEYRAQKPAC